MSNKKRFKRIYLELSNFCNLNCVFCTPSNKNNRIISYDNAVLALNQIKDYTDEICFHVLGEPLIHKDFFEIANKAIELGLKINLSTNTRLLIKNKENILKTKISTFNFSLHSLYDYDEKENYILSLLKFIDEYQSIYKNSTFHLRLWADSNQIIKENNDLIKKILFNYYNILKSDDKRIRLKERVILSFEEEFEWPSINNQYYKEGHCLGGKTHIAILANLDVVMCCLDTASDTFIGSLKKQTLDEILSGNLYLSAMKKFQENKCYFEICKHCSYKG